VKRIAAWFRNRVSKRNEQYIAQLRQEMEWYNCEGEK
jgi:hypothetical protein